MGIKHFIPTRVNDCHDLATGRNVLNFAIISLKKICKYLCGLVNVLSSFHRLISGSPGCKKLKRMMKRRRMLNDKYQGVFMIDELSFSECNGMCSQGRKGLILSVAP